MKKVFATLVAAAILALLICGLVGIASPALGDDSMYIVVEGTGWGYYYIMYDKDTGVMYHMSTGNYNGGTLTLLVNPDGTPKVHKDFTDQKQGWRLAPRDGQLHAGWLSRGSGPPLPAGYNPSAALPSSAARPPPLWIFHGQGGLSHAAVV